MNILIDLTAIVVIYAIPISFFVNAFFGIFKRKSLSRVGFITGQGALYDGILCLIGAILLSIIVSTWASPYISDLFLIK